MCLAQSQDGKALPSGSGCDLSELIKRRLESVASTGSSASSGFIEDKSYCDSEEEEEGSNPTAFLSPPPLSPSPLPILPLSLSLSLSSHLSLVTPPPRPALSAPCVIPSPQYLMKSFLFDS